MPEPAESLRLEPFRGVRYRKGLDLAAVTAPPYDVIDTDAVRELVAAEPHNLVRLILPAGQDRDQRLGAARDTLDRWLRDGTLQVDRKPALYVYEAAQGETVLLRGLIGALRLPPAGSRAVVPHEDVMPPVVIDRTDLQHRLQAQVEPIWLVYQGGGAASGVVAEVAGRAPLEECVSADGLRHRLWAVRDGQQLSAVEADLAQRQAMIADGHHRYAAYLAVQADARATGRLSGPEDLGLALLVDTTVHAPRLAAIHRVVHGLRLETVETTNSLGAAQPWRAASAALRPGRLLLVDADGTAYPLDLPGATDRQALFEGTVGAEMPVSWQELDAALLHEVLLPAWGVAEEAVTYYHAAEAAVSHAAREEGLAVLLAPVGVDVVLDLAAQGIRMPRKSTSFGPKPRGGFVLRSFRW